MSNGAPSAGWARRDDVDTLVHQRLGLSRQVNELAARTGRAVGPEAMT